MKSRIWLSAAMAVAMCAASTLKAATPLSILSGAAPSAQPESPQVKDDLLAGTEKFAQGASDVSEVNLDKNMLGMVKGKGKGGDLAGKMDFVVVRSYSYDKPGMYRMEDFENVRKRLTDGSWSCFIHTKDKDDSTDICARSSDHGETNEMVIMTAEKKGVTFVHLKGRMSLDDLKGMQSMGGASAGRKSMPAPPAPPAPARGASSPAPTPPSE